MCLMTHEQSEVSSGGQGYKIELTSTIDETKIILNINKFCGL